MLLHTQQAPLKEDFHIKYNSDDVPYQKLSLTKQSIILCNSPTAQLYVLEIASGHLLLKTVTGTVPCLLYDTMYSRTKGA